MYAVVEPYVTSAQLQAELFKRGSEHQHQGRRLAVLGHAAGPRAPGPVHGRRRSQPPGRRVGHPGRRAGASWVRWARRTNGSAATGPGPPCAPSSRASCRPAARRACSPRSRMKLYHWPGPARYSLAGNSPKYTLARSPANMMARYYSFPTLDKMWQAELKIGESEIAHGADGLQRRHGRRQHHHLQRRRRGDVPPPLARRCRAPASS